MYKLRNQKIDHGLKSWIKNEFAKMEENWYLNSSVKYNKIE